MAAAKGVVTLIKASTPRREEESHWEGGEEEREREAGRRRERGRRNGRKELGKREIKGKRGRKKDRWRERKKRETQTESQTEERTRYKRDKGNKAVKTGGKEEEIEIRTERERKIDSHSHHIFCLFFFRVDDDCCPLISR